MNIRFATSQDAEILANIGRQSFHEAFAEHPKNDPADMKTYMDEAFSVENIYEELAEKDSVWFIAEVENEAIGYAKLKTNSREEGISGENPIELCRLYNLQKFIGNGYGKALMLKCLEFARENRHDMFWLGVWEFNYNAQKFYTKFGLEKCGEHVFQLGKDPQTDWLMQRNLT
jgi:diamine N-acetyltransferase